MSQALTRSTMFTCFRKKKYRTYTECSRAIYFSGLRGKQASKCQQCGKYHIEPAQPAHSGQPGATGGAVDE